MGWKTQGYYFDSSDEALQWKWQVYGDTDGKECPEIEKFHNTSPDLGEYQKDVEIQYGPSSAPFFRGYVKSDNLPTAQEILKKFEGYAVFKNKYGTQIAQFSFHNLNIVDLNGIFLFYEKRHWSEDDWMQLKDAIVYLVPDGLKKKVGDAVAKGRNLGV